MCENNNFGMSTITTNTYPEASRQLDPMTPQRVPPLHNIVKHMRRDRENNNPNGRNQEYMQQPLVIAPEKHK